MLHRVATRVSRFSTKSALIDHRCLVWVIIAKPGSATCLTKIICYNFPLLATTIFTWARHNSTQLPLNKIRDPDVVAAVMIISNGGLFFSIVDFVDFSLLFLSFSSFVSFFCGTVITLITTSSSSSSSVATRSRPQDCRSSPKMATFDPECAFNATHHSVHFNYRAHETAPHFNRDTMTSAQHTIRVVVLPLSV